MITHPHRKILARLLFVLTMFFGIGVSPARGDSIMPENKVPGQVESKARRLMHDLKKEGFEVTRGYFKLWTADQCAYTFEWMGMCYGNNPAAPYVLFAVPPWPEEFVDPVTSTLWGPSEPGYIDVYRLDPREAIVILAQLPPPGAFFSGDSASEARTVRQRDLIENECSVNWVFVSSML